MGSPYPASIQDEGGETRVQGFVTFTDPSNQPASVPLAVVTVYLQVVATAASAGGNGVAVQQQVSGVCSPGAVTFGDTTVTATIPLTTYAAGAAVATVGDALVSISENSSDAFDLSCRITVQNETGSEAAALVATHTIPESPNGGTYSFQYTDFNLTAITGTDLTYNSETGAIHTTAGGSFWTVASLSGNYD